MSHYIALYYIALHDIHTIHYVYTCACTHINTYSTCMYMQIYIYIYIQTLYTCSCINTTCMYSTCMYIHNRTYTVYGTETCTIHDMSQENRLLILNVFKNISMRHSTCIAQIIWICVTKLFYLVHRCDHVRDTLISSPPICTSTLKYPSLELAKVATYRGNTW